MQTPKQKRKIIVTCAITGSVHTRSMSRYLPITPTEIAEQAIEAAEAGATMLHLHARDPESGKPSQDPSHFAEFLSRIKQSTNAIVNITTGGSYAMPIEERLEPASIFKPEVASLNMGTMNFGLFPILERFDNFEHSWERTLFEQTRSSPFRNTFDDIETILKTCADNGTRFEIECYDIGHLYTCAHFVDRGLIKPPFFIQSVFGILGGIGVHHEDVAHMRRTADKLFGDDYVWSVLGAGRAQLPIATNALLMGGNVRVGLEDNLWSGAGVLSKSNAEQVSAIRTIIEGLSLEVATPAEAREMLELKGGDNVAF